MIKHFSWKMCYTICVLLWPARTNFEFPAALHNTYLEWKRMLAIWMKYSSSIIYKSAEPATYNINRWDWVRQVRNWKNVLYSVEGIKKHARKIYVATSEEESVIERNKHLKCFITNNWYVIDFKMEPWWMVQFSCNLFVSSSQFPTVLQI